MEVLIWIQCGYGFRINCTHTVCANNFDLDILASCLHLLLVQILIYSIFCILYSGCLACSCVYTAHILSGQTANIELTFPFFIWPKWVRLPEAEPDNLQGSWRLKWDCCLKSMSWRPPSPSSLIIVDPCPPTKVWADTKKHQWPNCEVTHTFPFLLYFAITDKAFISFFVSQVE